jgi:ATP-binding cassette subfamily F protein 3
MIVLATEKIYKDFSATLVLEAIDIQVQKGQKVGLLGPNGSGKTTLLRIIAGELEPDSGRVMLARGCKVGYQSQEFSFAPGVTVLEEGLSVFAHLAEMERELRRLEQELAKSNGHEEAMNRYAQLSHEFEEQGGYSYPARTRSILHGLGFGEEELSKSVELLSGGQQSRLALAKLLLADPDLLLLDEPTNHLDIAAINWLENYLKGFRGGLLMVSHDRRFLENLADTIWEMVGTRMELYPGNYQFYRREREQRREKQLKGYLAQQEYIKRTEDFIARNIEGQNTKQAQSRRRELAKLQRLAPPPPETAIISFKFEQRRPSGRHVLRCQHLAKSFAGKKVFNNISFHLERGQRAGLIGPNGCGKTTLLEIICGLQKPDSGKVSFGHYVELAYFSQLRNDLDPGNSAADEIWSLRPSWTRGEIQGFLARFLFRGDDAFKLTKHMSGGEASRLALAKLLLSKANFLVLDEPTNHLDLDSKEVLEAALDQYPGTVLTVSHDRWFLSRVTNMTLEMTAEGLKRYQGNYDYWLSKKEEEAREKEEALAQAGARPKSSPEPARGPNPASKLSPNEIYRRKQRLAQLEQDIAATEKRQSEVNQEIMAQASDHQKLHALSTELQLLHNELEKYYGEWESLTHELEENS